VRFSSKERIEETDALMHMAKDLLEADAARVLAGLKSEVPGTATRRGRGQAVDEPKKKRNTTPIAALAHPRRG